MIFQIFICKEFVKKMQKFKINIKKHFKEYISGQSDCWTLVKDIYKENGIELPDYIEVNSISKRNEFKKWLFKNLEIEEVNKYFCGVILLFEGDPWHCGVCINEKEFIHRDKKINTKVEKIDSYRKPKGLYLITKKNI